MNMFRRWFRQTVRPKSGEVVVAFVHGQAQLTVDRVQRLPILPAKQSSPSWSIPRSVIGVTLTALTLVLPSPTAAAAYTAEPVVTAINAARTENGVSTLTMNTALAEAATAKAQDMIIRQYFDHTSPTGQTTWAWLRVANYQYTEAGENLAKNFISADDLVRAWLSSSSHRQNMLNQRFDEIGVAVQDGMIGGKKTNIVVAYFGSRTIVEPTFAPQAPAPMKPKQIALPLDSSSTPVIALIVPPSVASSPTPLSPLVPSLVHPEGAPVPTLLLTYAEPTAYVGTVASMARVLGLDDVTILPDPAPLTDLSKLVGLALMIQAAGVIWFGIHAGSFGNFRLAGMG